MRNVEKFVEIGSWYHVKDYLKVRLTSPLKNSKYNSLQIHDQNLIWNNLRFSVADAVTHPTMVKIENKLWKYKF